MLHIPPVHPIAEKFPFMPRQDWESLVIDIKKDGQRKPIALHQGYIWDGRARAEACRHLGLQPRYWIMRREDPIVFMIVRHDRYGAPLSPERDEALKVLHELDRGEWKLTAKNERRDWLAEARREFRLMVPKAPRNCDVCGQHVEMVHAHHSLPLNLQFSLGLPSAIHEHDWLCPLHHRIIHVFCSIFITGAREGDFLERLHPSIEPEWARTSQVFQKGYRLFQKFGGEQHWHGRFWNEWMNW